MRRTLVLCLVLAACQREHPVQQHPPIVNDPPRSSAVIPDVIGGSPQYPYPIYRYPDKGRPRPEDIVRYPQVKPVRIAGDPPKYPEAARRARVSGIVIVEVLIEKDGRVTAVQILKPLPFGLDQAVVDAVRTWKYKPAMQDGKRVRTVWKEAIAIHPPQERLLGAQRGVAR